MKHAITALFIATGSTATAGCASYTESNSPAPRYLACYDDVCDETTLDYQCANVSSAQTGYANGWRVNCEIENGTSTCQITWQGRTIDPAKHDRISFKPLD